ncbi:hypothetical protein GCM10009593_16640 [Microlunatus antarcticus]
MTRQHKAKQHTVPKTLLRGFVDTRSRLALRRRDGTESLISVNNASVRTNFYSYTGAAGALVDDIEDWLSSDIEGPVAPVLIRARRGDPLNAPDNTALARFAASGLLRTATTRARLEQVGEHIGPVLVLHEHLVNRKIDPTTLSPDALNAAQVAATAVWERLGKPDEPAQANLRIFLREFDRLSERLNDWTWSVRTAPRACLITADAPVAVLPSADLGWQGILPPGSPVFIPISSRQLLIGEPRRPLAGGDQLLPELASVVNARLAFEAYDALFASPSAPWPDVPPLSPTRPTMPTPTVTWSRSDGSADTTTSPSYPEINDPAIRRLIDDLGGSDDLGS